MLTASWNVNGIRAVARRNQLPWQMMPEVELWCLQETKAHPDQLEADLREPDGWHAHWFSAQKPGYSSVAIVSRQAPDEIIEGLNVTEFDVEGRVLAARFGTLVVLSAYFPNAQELGKRIAYKLGFCAALESCLAHWRQRGCETLLLGDYNIAHRPIDLARPHDNEMNPGYLPQERAWMDHFLGLGYRDVYRERYPDLRDTYTWWTMRGGARARNVGWRIDYGTTSPGLASRVREAAIHSHIMGSDHCPVTIAL